MFWTGRVQIPGHVASDTPSGAGMSPFTSPIKFSDSRHRMETFTQMKEENQRSM